MVRALWIISLNLQISSWFMRCPTYRRVGYAMVMQHFPEWIPSTAIKNAFFETFALTCLFHDLGTIPANRTETHMSFEFQSGYIALQKLESHGVPRAQAESVAEAVIRHQDAGDTGMITRMGQLIQMATELGESCGSFLTWLNLADLSEQTIWEPKENLVW